MPVCNPPLKGRIETPSHEAKEIGTEDVPPLRRPGRLSVWIVAVLLAVICLAAGLLATFTARPAASTEPASFGFRVEQRQDHLLLTWNPGAPAIRDATRATLVIHDGPETEDVDLNLAVLRAGGLSYSPVFRNLSFGLSLANPSRPTVSEQAAVIFRP